MVQSLGDWYEGYILWNSATTVGWWCWDKPKQIRRSTILSATDPMTWVNGAIAGAVGRVAALPFDNGGAKGAAQAVIRRMPQYSLLFGLYIPVADTMNGRIQNQPMEKFFTTVLLGMYAGFSMRFLTNPISRVMDESVRMNLSPIETIKTLNRKTPLQFWYTTAPMFANSLYCAGLLAAFEGYRRLFERNGLLREENGLIVNSCLHGACGAAAGLTASTLTYPYSAHRYLQTVIHDSAICRGLLPTLLKEVPMTAVAFGTFSFLQGVLNKGYGFRAGFGS